MRKMLFKLLTLALIFQSSAWALDLDSLLQKSAGGEEAINTLKTLESWEARGKAEVNGQEASFVEYYLAPDKHYTKVTMPGFTLIRAYDGETIWRTDMNGRASKIEGYTRNQELADFYMESFAYLRTDSLDKVAKYNGINEKQGKAYHEVAFFPCGADTLYAYLDTATGLVARTISKFDQHTSVSDIDDYRSISGLLFPFHVKNGDTADIEIEVFIQSVELNKAVDSSIFALPEVKMTDFKFPEGVSQVTLEVKYIDGHIWIPVTVNGTKKVWMVLDTGASGHMFNRFALEDLKLPEVGKLSALGVAGAEDAALIQTDSIQIGDLTLYDQIGGSMDLSAIRSPIHDGLDFGGLLGQDFWSRFPILVEYARSRLTVYNPESFTAPTGGTEVPFYLTMLIPTIQCEVNGVQGDFLVDIGNSSGLVLNRPFIDKYELEKKLSMSLYNRRAFGGIGGFVTGRNGYTSKFRMGDVELKSLLCFVPDTAVGLLASEVIAGNIGNKVLDKYRILLDYGESRIIYYSYY